MLTADTLLSEDFRHAIADQMAEFIATRSAALLAIDSALEPVLVLARDLTAGGKRFRPAACAAGWLAVQGRVDAADEVGLLQAAASLDLLHVSALVHDDVMDASGTRRGMPAAHVALADMHRERGLRGDPEAFGRAGAILLGDLLLAWSAQMFDEAALPAQQLDAARPLLAACREEVTAGQFLDVLAATKAPSDPDALAVARQVVEFKTSRYTVIRPAQVGAALAGGSQTDVDALARFGSPVGRAFQLRDDVLGVFGDAALTGKPVGDDLREGKRTVLVAHTFARADEAGREQLDAILGRADLSAAEVQEAQEVIAASGALEQVEADIAADRTAALAVLNELEIAPEGCDAFTRLVAAAIDRAF